MVELRNGGPKSDRRATIGLRRTLLPTPKTFVLFLVFVMLMFVLGTAPASAVDRLSPRVGIPSWARGKAVHYDPAEPQNRRLAGGDRVASDASTSPLTLSTDSLRYHGGEVQNEPRLALIFFGKEWEVEPALALRRTIETTAEGLAGSGYENLLTQYSSVDGPISPGPLIDSPTIEKYYITREVTTKIDEGAAASVAREVMGSTWDHDITYAVLPAPGIAGESSSCGFHEQEGGTGSVFTPGGPSIAVIMATGGRIGCGPPSMILTHEYAESVTDPGSGSWHGSNLNTEIGDICNHLGPQRMADGALVAALWDDSKNACEVEDNNPGSVPIGPYTESSLDRETNQSVESEMLEASLEPCDLEAHYYFEYGTSTAYGTRTEEAVVPAAWGDVKVDVTVARLQHSTPYHWRVVIKTSNGTAYGVDHEFTTPYYVEATSNGASNVGFAEATLNGEVQPGGVEAKYYFEYGTTEAYDSRTAEESAGSGKAFVKVSAVLNDLAPGTLYHFRIVASSSRGPAFGEDHSFSTLGGKPRVETSPATSIRYTEATLTGTINPRGVATSYYFEYGTTSAYGQQTSEQSAGEGLAEYERRAVLGDLTADTTYHFRIVATNSYGTSYGADESFSTRQEPFVETGAPETIGYDDATLSGAINPHSIATSYYFEYGTSQSYGKRTAQVSAGADASTALEIQAINGLTEGTTYHFRMVATTSFGTTYGAGRAFSTATQPSVQTNAPTGVALPPLIEAIGPAPLQPDPTPNSPPPRGPSLQVARHGNSLVVLLDLALSAPRVEADATVPEMQLGAAKRRGRPVSVVIASAVHTGVEVGRSTLVLPLDWKVRRALRRPRGLTLTVTVTVTTSSGDRQTIAHTLALAGRKS